MKYTEFNFKVYASFYLDGDEEEVLDYLDGFGTDICGEGTICEVSVDTDEIEVEEAKAQDPDGPFPAYIYVTVDAPAVMPEKLDELTKALAKAVDINEINIEGEEQEIEE